MKRLVRLPREHVRLSGAELFIDSRNTDAPFQHVGSQATSTSSSKSRPVEFGKRASGVGATEVPVDGDFAAIAWAGLGGDVPRNVFEGGEATIETLAGQR